RSSPCSASSWPADTSGRGRGAAAPRTASPHPTSHLERRRLIMGWKIVTGSDNAGVGHKSALQDLLENDPRVDEVIDAGVTGREDGTYYPHGAVGAAQKVAAGDADRAPLLCGAGGGGGVGAAKGRGGRAVTAHDLYSVQRSVLSTNAQVLGMGERVVGLELAKELVKVWLDLEFDPESSSAAKVDAICAYDGSLDEA